MSGSTDLYDFEATPTVNSISPPRVRRQGAPSVSVPISGFDFDLDDATIVRFGDAAAESYTVVSSSILEAVTPPGVVGTVGVSVATDGGSASSPAIFTYTAPSSVTGADGYLAGGQRRRHLLLR